MLALPAARHSNEPFVESVLCLTDFSAPGLNAFAHALMMALTLRCRFVLFHAGETKDADLEWSQIPGVRQVLEKWGYLEKGSSRSAVLEKAAIDVDKVYVQSKDALGELSHFLKRHPVDLLVIGTDAENSVSSWLHPSATRRLTWDTHIKTMFVPASGGFVSLTHGGFTLQRVLVPVSLNPDPQPAITYAFRAAVFSTEEVIDMHLLHIGDHLESLQLDPPERDYLRWELISRDGNVSDEILRAASELNAGLISMTTNGIASIFVSSRASVTERVVQAAKCPVLVIPA